MRNLEVQNKLEEEPLLCPVERLQWFGDVIKMPRGHLLKDFWTGRLRVDPEEAGGTIL